LYLYSFTLPHEWSCEGISLICYVAPWATSCVKWPESEEPAKVFHITYLEASPLGTKKTCSCHTDFWMQVFDKNTGKKVEDDIYHGKIYMSCDSDFFEPKNWRDADMGWYNAHTNWPNKWRQQIRTHCD